MSKLKKDVAGAPTPPAAPVEATPSEVPEFAVALNDPILDTARVVLGALLSRQVTLPDPDSAAKNAIRYAVALHAERSNWGA